MCDSYVIYLFIYLFIRHTLLEMAQKEKLVVYSKVFSYYFPKEFENNIKNLSHNNESPGQDSKP
jgi:hypothetical protein